MRFPDIEPRRRTTLLRVAAATWLLLISAAVVINHVALSNLADQTDSNAPEFAQLHARLVDLDERIEQWSQPPAVPLARYQSERQALEQRLDAIEQALAERLTADHLLPLESRLRQLEARQAATRSAAATVTRPRTPEPAPVRVTPAEPPFQILGTELRGGEAFLSVLPADAAALPQVRLLCPGEAEAGWRLEALDGAAAVFRLGDETRRLSIPVR